MSCRSKTIQVFLRDRKLVTVVVSGVTRVGVIVLLKYGCTSVLPHGEAMAFLNGNYGHHIRVGGQTEILMEPVIILNDKRYHMCQ